MNKVVVVSSGMSDLDKDLVKTLFKLKALSLEYVEEVVGVYSAQRRIIDTAHKLIDYMSEFSRTDSFFYIFMGDETEENLKLIVNTVVEKTDKTKYFAVKLHSNWLDFSVNQLSLSGKMFTKVR